MVRGIVPDQAPTKLANPEHLDMVRDADSQLRGGRNTVYTEIDFFQEPRRRKKEMEKKKKKHKKIRIWLEQ